MTYLVPSGYSRVQFDFAPAGALGSTPTWGFGCSAPPSIALLDSLQLWAEGGFRSKLGNNWTLVQIRAYDDTNAIVRLMGLTGTYSGAQANPALAALVSLSTALRGRENRGRIYLPGLLQDGEVNDDGSLQGTGRVAVQNLVDDLRTAIDDAFPGGDLVILHTTSSDPTPVVNAEVSGVAATQRRRLRK